MNKKYDLIVIGGGPAGMMAAGRAGELGSLVLLLEKNPSLGVKLLITGKSRCNITNSTDEEREMINRFGVQGRFLFSAFHQFGVFDLIDFFESRGLSLKTERGGRVFPQSDKSFDVLNILLAYLKSGGVEIETGAEVKEVVKNNNKIEKVILNSGKEFRAEKFIIATGGLSYSATGSTGDGYNWLEDIGHNITDLSPSLSPILIRGKIPKELEGLSLKNVEISIYKNKKKIDSRFGEALFTANGMSGPVIIDMSKVVGQNLGAKLELRIDFKPALDFTALDRRVQNDFRDNSNRMFKNSLDSLLPQKMIPVIISLSGISEDKKVNLIGRGERKKIVHLMKEFNLEISGLFGYDKAIITSGGVDLKEVDPKTMKSKIIDNLYLVGEILDLDGPTGGYNLQVCWSTGYVAGSLL